MKTRNNFHENVSELELLGGMRKRNNMIVKNLMNGMTVHLNIFSALMKNWIASNMYSLVNIKRCDIMPRES